MKVFDEICIKKLEVFGNHGVLPEETALGQKFIVNLTLFLNLSKAGRTDHLNHTVNYAEICSFITTFMKENTFQLIEACAEHLCEELLTNYESIDHLTLEIEKPWAPIGLPLDTVSVKMTRGWHIAYIALGSNMGDRRSYFSDAIESLEAQENCQVLKISDYITTPPYGPVEQEDFLNGCLMLRTTLAPNMLLDLLHTIEKNNNRTREVHWGPRTLDLDILLYDDLIMETDKLTIPHIEMHKRNFVLEPLNQIAPYAIHPVLHKTIRSLYEELD